MELHKENRAHTTTWNTLYQFGQIKSNFADIGKVLVSEFGIVSFDEILN